MGGTWIALARSVGDECATFVEVFMRRSLIVLALTAAASASAAPSFAGPFTVTTLATKATDPQLVNPWGLASSGASPEPFPERVPTYLNSSGQLLCARLMVAERRNVNTTGNQS